MTTDTKKDKQRAKVYDALGNSKRIALLKTLSEGPMGFAELKKTLRIKSSGHLTHHLNKLDDLIKTDDHGKYCLSDKGKDALLAMKPIEKYDEDSRFKDQVGILIRALRSDSPGVQDVAIVQLSLFGPKAVPYLASALSRALDEFSDSQYPEDLMRRYSRIENAEKAVSNIVRVLGIIGAPASVSDVVKALPRPVAFEALAKIGNKQSLNAVISAMPKWFSESKSPWRDYSNEVNSEAAAFLRKVFGHFDEEEVRKELESLLRKGNETAKNSAAKILAVVGDSRSFPALIETLENSGYSTKAEAAHALLRLRANEAIPNIISELIKMQDESSTELETESGTTELLCNVKIALAEAVLELGSVDDLLQIKFHRPKLEFRGSGKFYDAIINSGETAIAGLTKLLQNPDADVQTEAAEMIARIKRGGRAHPFY